MANTSIDRRQFIGACVVTAAGMSSMNCAREAPPAKSPYDAHDLQTRPLGTTGVAVPVIAMGLGSRFCSVSDPEQSVAILERALDLGMYHWDTGHDYVYNDVVSEERIGLVLKDRRDEVFMATKIADRTRDGGLRHVEESLQRLQTDHLDLLQIHNVQSIEDVEAICADGGVLETVQALKEQGVTRFVGFTGHSAPEALAELARRFDFDTVLFAMNHYSGQDRQGVVIPEAVSRNMGILMMKVIRPREEDETVMPVDLLRYALSLDHVTATVIGTDGLDVLEQNAAFARYFTPMPAEGMEAMAARLRPVYARGTLAWMQPGYTDGIAS